MSEVRWSPCSGRAKVALLLLVASAASGGATPGDQFAESVIRRLGGIATRCPEPIRAHVRQVRERRPGADFRARCSLLPPQWASLEQVQREVRSAARWMQEQTASVVPLRDWTEHQRFGPSFDCSYSVADQRVVVWWHPATRTLEIRIWKESAANPGP